MRYTITKIRNGLWVYENEKGVKTEHSTQSGAEKMAISHEHFHRSRFPQEMLLMSDCINCGQKVNSTFVEATVDDILRTASIDWLRSEIEKLEEELSKIPKIIREPFELAESVGKRMFIDSIITRYKEELKVLEKEI